MFSVEMSQKRGHGGYKTRGRFQRPNNRGYNNQGDGPGPSSILKTRIGFQHGNRGGPANRRQFLQRIGLPVSTHRGGRGGNQGRNVQAVNRTTWNKIMIPRGKEYGREFLFKQLSTFVDGKFHPVLFKLNDNADATFFIEDNDVAQAVETASRRIVAPNGQKVIINVVKHEAPYTPLDPSDVEAVKKALQDRFDHVNEHINLSAFIDDPNIKQTGNYLSLSRNNVMMAVVNLLGEACPNLKSIDISRNRLRFIDFFACLPYRCTNVVRLNLSNNIIDHINELEKLSIWDLIDLDLDGNPVCSKYRESSAYISSVRRFFPKLQRLDGTDLPPVFRTGIEEELHNTKVPPSKFSFFVDDRIKQMCGEFIEEYFTIFDNTDRQKRQRLLEAYDDDAVFTLSASNLTEAGNMARSQSWTEFIRDSHNIKMMHIWNRYRSKICQNGRLSIVSYFCKDYPLTQHDPSSFVIDVSLVTDSLVCLNVSGLCKEANALPTDASRFFTRVFLLIWKNSRLAILNEELFVSTLGSNQETSYRTQVDQMKTSSGVGVPSENQIPQMMMADVNQPLAQPSGVVVVNQPTNDEASQQMMIERFSQISGMKPEWALKCLTDCAWDFQRAGDVFTQLNNTGGIPAEAFIANG